jgi:hypothetical protein
MNQMGGNPGIADNTSFEAQMKHEMDLLK